MATLTGQNIANTYKQLLQVGSDNAGLTTSVQTIQDGSGTNSALQLSQATVNINGTFQLNGSTLTATASALNAVPNITSYTGFIAVSGTNINGRTLVAGTGVSITNADGTEGNPNIFLNTTGVVSGSYGPFTKFDVNSVGQIVSATAVSTSVSIPTVRASEFIGGTFKGTTADFSSDTSIGGSIVVENTAVFNSTVSVSGSLTGSSATFTENVSASFFYGDGSNLTNLPTAPTSVSAYTVNQLTIVNAATLAGTDLETRINTVSVNTSVNSTAITSINAIIGDGGNYATSAELATVSAYATSIVQALSATMATSIDNSNTNITTNANAITSINAVVAGVSVLTQTNLDSITSINTVVGNVSAVTSVNSAAITSINTVVANVSSTLATSIANHLPLAGGTLTGTVSGTNASFSGNVSASFFYGDGSNLTNLPAAPTSVTSFTVNQLTAVSTTSLMGITYPTTDGTSGQVIQTNGAGALTFVSVATDINGLSDAVTNSSGVTIGLGTGALANDDGTSNNNTALGYNALNDITTGEKNVGIGSGAGQTLTTAEKSVYIGYFAGGNADTNATNNVCIGNSAGYATSSQYSVYIGDGSGEDGSGSYNVAVGRYTLNASGTGSSNTAVGYTAGFGITDGIYNSLFGRNAGRSITTGNYNNIFGSSAGYYITTGVSNVVIGTEAGENITTGSNNVFIGQEAGESQVGTKLTGDDNAGIGRRALTSMRGTNTRNTAVGAYALGGSGFDADDNTAVGYGAGESISTGDNNTCIGYDSEPSSGTASNEVTLGNASITSLRCNQTTISSLSDSRDKTNIEDLTLGLNFINDLRPVKFLWDRRDGTMSGISDAGFIAQELDNVQTKYEAEDYLRMVLKTNPEKLEAAPGKLIPVLVKAIQELSQEVERLKEGK